MIERSGATTITELLSKVLPMSTSTNNSSYFTASSSQINLRGLGASQTLVLINGRRSAGTGNRGTSESTDQPNLNNIPLAAIERIEVLPTSAAAIYGSGAVGGVINVILRKDYAGTQVDLRYADTTDNKQPVSSINVVSGFALEEGRTHVMMTASKKIPMVYWCKKKIGTTKHVKIFSKTTQIQFMARAPLVQLQIIHPQEI